LKFAQRSWLGDSKHNITPYGLTFDCVQERLFMLYKIQF
jgi:hypothetical protein